MTIWPRSTVSDKYGELMNATVCVRPIASEMVHCVTRSLVSYVYAIVTALLNASAILVIRQAFRSKVNV